MKQSDKTLYVVMVNHDTVKDAEQEIGRFLALTSAIRCSDDARKAGKKIAYVLDTVKQRVVYTSLDEGMPLP